MNPKGGTPLHLATVLSLSSCLYFFARRRDVRLPTALHLVASNVEGQAKRIREGQAEITTHRPSLWNQEIVQSTYVMTNWCFFHQLTLHNGFTLPYRPKKKHSWVMTRQSFFQFFFFFGNELMMTMIPVPHVWNTLLNFWKVNTEVEPPCAISPTHPPSRFSTAKSVQLTQEKVCEVYQLTIYQVSQSS